VEAMDQPTGALVAAKVEALVGLGADTGPAPVLAPVGKTPAPGAFPATETIEPMDKPGPAPVEDAAKPGPAPVAPVPAARRVAIDATVEDRAPPQPATAAPDDDLGPEAPPPPHAKPVAAAPAAVAKKKPEAPPPRPRKLIEPKIFVPPRAPDDPGPDPATDAGSLEVGPFRPSGAKA
jgi:hypothetical protein